MIAGWNEPGAQDCAWLIYSANYLLRTAGVHWAIDPLRLEQRLPGSPPVDYAGGLAQLSLVVLTHRHSDHLDIPLIRSLSHLPILWIVPEPLRQQVMSQGGIPAARILVPRPMQPIEVQGLRLTPFDGLHWEHEAGPEGQRLRGVPALGYLAEFGGKRWLFPGDTRTYNAAQLPSLGPVDGLFAHLWLGRGCARQARPPLLEAFCRFLLDLQPHRIVLAHLQEFGRPAEEYWDVEHAELAASTLRQLCPDVSVQPALMGDRIPL